MRWCVVTTERDGAVSDIHGPFESRDQAEHFAARMERVQASSGVRFRPRLLIPPDELGE